MIKDVPRRRRSKGRRADELRMQEVLDKDNPRPVPAMPTVETSDRHRLRDHIPVFPACVARPVPKGE
eukprot:7767084-Lingulodinium_polyedra.AAC.1